MPLGSLISVRDCGRGALGYQLAIFRGGTLRAVARTPLDCFASLRAPGTTEPFRGRMLDLAELNGVLGTEGARRVRFRIRQG